MSETMEGLCEAMMSILEKKCEAFVKGGTVETPTFFMKVLRKGKSSRYFLISWGRLDSSYV